MTRLLFAALLLCLPAQDALAGAWPRKQGAGFVSLATRLAWPQDTATWTSPAPADHYETFYLEYGLTDRLTLGFDLGRSVSGNGKAIAFAQLPLRQADKGPQLAAQLGVGRISGDAIIRPGLSLGWGRKNGWVSLDSVAEIALDGGETDYKLDITWGRNLAQDRKLIIQLQTGVQENDPGFARLAPSLVVPVRKKIKAELGATWGLTGDASMGIKFGLWADF